MRSPAPNKGGWEVRGCLSARYGTRPSYQNFSGNAVAVASMCADLYQYRPVAANEGGKQKITLPQFSDVFRPVWLTTG